MGLFLSIFITVIILTTLSRWLWWGPRYVEVQPARPRLALEARDALPDERVDEFGDLCVTITATALELHKDYEEVLEILGSNDGLSGVEAADKMRYATTGAQEILDKASAVMRVDEWMPEDAEDWLQHAIDTAEHLVELDDENVFQKGGDSDIPIAIMEQATEKVEVLLLAASDFSRRMLDFNLFEWVKEDLGPDKLKRMRRAVKAAEQQYD